VCGEGPKYNSDSQNVFPSVFVRETAREEDHHPEDQTEEGTSDVAVPGICKVRNGFFDLVLGPYVYIRLVVICGRDYESLPLICYLQSEQDHEDYPTVDASR
jgi:hypothetical protein